jgi:hypothetical protein
VRSAGGSRACPRRAWRRPAASWRRRSAASEARPRARPSWTATIRR